MRLWKDKVPIIHLVGETAADARDVMIEGESGILATSPPHDRPLYEPSKRRVTWKNGAIANVFSAEDPDQLRGPHCYKAWADELAKWRYPDAWDQLVLGAQLGENPQIIVTTTPRPTKIIKDLIKEKDTYLTTGTTFENKANLAPKFLDKIVKRYEGTRLGKQELLAKILTDIEGALWNYKMIDENRVKKAPVMKRLVVAIDPATTAKKTSDETGIVIAGLGVDDKGYVLGDKSGIYTPNGWGKKAINAYYDNEADLVVAEVNNGGDMVETILRNLDVSIPYKDVWASRGKITRAEPIHAFYEQGRIKHVGTHEGLETQMTTWDSKAGEKSPDRVDALVWAFTELMITSINTNIWA
jgi:phage terminase large subunit-like protein